MVRNTSTEGPAASHLHILTRCVGDTPVLLEAKNQIRQSFLSNAKMGAAEPATKEAIQHANEVANFLRVNLVQGRHMGDADNTYRKQSSAVCGQFL